MKLSLDNLKSIIKSKYIFENKPTVAVAVSGGPDSMCLLFLINSWIKIKKGKVIAIIVDHGIRKESNYESKSINKYLTGLKIKSKILSVKKNLHKKKEYE